MPTGDRRVGASDDLAGQVDARDERADPGDLAVGPRRQPVLEVDARPADPDVDLAGRQVGGRELADAAVDVGAAVGVLELLGDVGAERVGDGAHGRKPSRRPARRRRGTGALGCGWVARVDAGSRLPHHGRAMTTTRS